VVGAYSLGVDERLFAANTVAREFLRHVDVHDVDTGGRRSGDSFLNGGVEECDCVVDLVLDGRGRIPWDDLKQLRIASDHDERVRRRIGRCHRGVQGAEAAPSLVNSAAARPISTWHSTGGTAVHAASTWERPKSAAPTVRVTNLVSSSSAAVSCLPLTSDVVAPVQAALTRRSIRILGSSRYG
jgi:hypothetical protein